MRPLALLLCLAATLAVPAAAGATTCVRPTPPAPPFEVRGVVLSPGPFDRQGEARLAVTGRARPEVPPTLRLQTDHVRRPHGQVTVVAGAFGHPVGATVRLRVTRRELRRRIPTLCRPMRVRPPGARRARAGSTAALGDWSAGALRTPPQVRCLRLSGLGEPGHACERRDTSPLVTLVRFGGGETAVAALARAGGAEVLVDDRPVPVVRRGAMTLGVLPRRVEPARISVRLGTLVERLSPREVVIDAGAVAATARMPDGVPCAGVRPGTGLPVRVLICRRGAATTWTALRTGGRTVIAGRAGAGVRRVTVSAAGTERALTLAPIGGAFGAVFDGEDPVTLVVTESDGRTREIAPLPPQGWP